MPLSSKIKLNIVAKNFDVKNKEIQDILTSHNITGKGPMANLEEYELNLIFENLTQKNQVDNIEDYIYRSGDYVEESAAPEKTAEISETPKPAKIDENAEPAKSVTSDKPDKAFVEVAKAKPDKIAEMPQKRPDIHEKGGKITQSSQNSQNLSNSQNEKTNKTVKPETAIAGNRNTQTHQPHQPHQNQPKQQSQQHQRSQHPQQTQQTQQYRPPSERPAYIKRQDNVSGKSGTTPNTAQDKFRQQQKPNQQQNRRDFSNPAFNKSSRQDRPDRKTQPARFNQQNNSNMQNNKNNKPNVTVDIISASDNIKFAAGVKNESAKIVDTRTSTVDLSRYDENLETFVVDSDKFAKGKKSTADEKQKIKRDSQRRDRSFDRSGRPVDKERLALEKLQKKQLEQEQEKARRKQLSIILPEKIIASDLAAKLRITSAEVIKKLFMLGVKVSVNEEIDYETSALLAMEFGAKVEKEVIITIEDKLFDESADEENKLVPRAPIVVVMGHVDHGKTSLLDAIKNTNVTAGEAGGITQHIGAYRVEVNGREITFLDTPGHAAFTAMRARGAQATDIAILVVAADDGIMPQTVEAINHAKAANVSIIVAINKMDKPQADPERVKQELTNYDLVPEEWGGDIVCVPVSAVTRQGLDELLEMILLTADMKELKANPDRLAQGIIIESKLDKGRGPISTVLIQNGTLNAGDIVIAGTTVGRVRAMTNDRGRTIKSAGPSVPVEVIGLSETPNAGDSFRAVEDERMARELVDRRKADEKEEQFKSSSNITLEDLFSQVKSGVKELNLIIKADVHGSVEALKSALIKESNEEVMVKVIHSAVGGITESDILLASASNAIVIGFNVRPDKTAIDTAERRGVDVRTYRIIYECIEEVNAAMKGMLAPKFKEVVLGHAQVRQTIRVPNIGTIAGSYIQDGKITRNSQIRIVRDGIVIFEDKILSLKRFKDDAREVAQGYECGIGLEKFNDVRELDILESFIIEQVQA